MHVSRLIVLLGGIFVVVSCVTSASGPRFSAMQQAPLPAGQARVFVLRDTVLYLAQGPGIGRPEVAIDGRVIGYLENGGFSDGRCSRGATLSFRGGGRVPTAAALPVLQNLSLSQRIRDKSKT